MENYTTCIALKIVQYRLEAMTVFPVISTYNTKPTINN